MINRAISSIRVEVEHQIGGIKRCQIVVQKFRNRVEDFADDMMETACGSHNFRLSYRWGKAHEPVTIVFKSKAQGRTQQWQLIGKKAQLRSR